MQKLTPFALIAATLIEGCASAQKSRTWETVKSVRHSGPAETQPAIAYAKKLHGVLQCAGVEHKVVTLKFRHDFRILLRRDAEETAVIYRDPATPRHPWWLMAERLSRPLWLPTAPSPRKPPSTSPAPSPSSKSRTTPRMPGRKRDARARMGRQSSNRTRIHQNRKRKSGRPRPSATNYMLGD